MESFVMFLAPVAIAFFGLILVWAISRIAANRQDTISEPPEDSVDKP